MKPKTGPGPDSQGETRDRSLGIGFAGWKFDLFNALALLIERSNLEGKLFCVYRIVEVLDSDRCGSAVTRRSSRNRLARCSKQRAGR